MTFGLVAPALAAEDWDALVKKYIEAYESVKEPVPTAYPWVAKRLTTLFGARGVGHIQVFSEKDGKRTLGRDIYYKASELHVINHDKGWNLVTKGKEAFEWETGEKEGLITKPKSLKEVPTEVFDRLKGVKFKHSDLSIRRHMVYL